MYHSHYHFSSPILLFLLLPYCLLHSVDLFSILTQGKKQWPPHIPIESTKI
jgi:hypothetical protein